MKIAVIGAGYWGKNHVRDLTDLGHDVVVCDLDKKNLENCEKNYKVKKSTILLEDVLLDSSISAATICVPNHLHFLIAKKFLESGKHVFVEKPMALKSSDCKTLIDVAKKQGVVLNVGHIFRFNNSVIKLRELVLNDYLGKIFIANFYWANLDKIYEDRDIVFDVGVHIFDIVNFLFGSNPNLVFSVGNTFRKESGEDAAFLVAKLEAILVSVELSWVSPPKKRAIKVVGSKKTALVDTLSQSIEVIDNSTLLSENIAVEALNPLKVELNHFVECIEKGVKSKASGEIGLEIVSFLEKAKKSMK